MLFSVFVAFLLKRAIFIPSSSSFHGGSSSHRLKKLEKWTWRGNLSQHSTCATSVPEGDRCESYVNSHGWEKSYLENEQCALGDKKKAAIFASRALEASRISDKDNVIDPAIRVPADGSFPILESCEQISFSGLSCEQKDTNTCDEINLCERFCQSFSFGLKIQRSFSKSATFPSSNEMCSDLPIAHSSASEISAYARSLSLHASLKPVSAMKGGRAQKGSSPKMELRVKWAPEVYDPPCTTVSHTVNGHRQRSKAKKKDNRKNKNKGKSPRGSSCSEKKNANHKYATNAGSHVNGPDVLLDGFGKSQVLNSVGGQEKKCATCFLREVLPKVHLPVGEAS